MTVYSGMGGAGCIKITASALNVLCLHTSACLQLMGTPVTVEALGVGTAFPVNQQTAPSDLSRARDNPDTSEDCLHLNVWTPLKKVVVGREEETACT